MGKIIDVYGKKFLSLALIFNSLLTLVYVIGLLSTFYRNYPEWRPYPPYIIHASLFLLLIPAALINIFPSMNIGKVETGRLWFHHYVYGFIIIAIATILTAIWFPTSMLSLFTANDSTAGINVGRFFIIGGLTLVVDDLPDVSKTLKSSLCFLKARAHQNRRIFHAVQLIMGFTSLYFLLAVSIYLPQHPAEITLANIILIGTLIVTTLTSFANATRKSWLKFRIEKSKSHFRH